MDLEEDAFFFSSFVVDFVMSFDWLEVADDFDGEGEGLLNLPLDGRGELVSRRDGRVLREQQVKLHEQLAPRVPVAKVMKIDVMPACFRLEYFTHPGIDSWIRLVHQAADGAAHEPGSRPEDVYRHNNCDEGIKGEPARPESKSESNDDSKACPAIREDMFPVRLEHNRMVFLAKSHEVPAQYAVYGCRQNDETGARVDVLKRESRDPLAGRLIDDVDGRKETART